MSPSEVAVRIDVAAAAAVAQDGARAIDFAWPDPPTPYTALEHALLEEARKSAAGTAGEDAPPRRELIRVVFRELQREQALRDAAEARELTLTRELARLRETVEHLRETRHGLFEIQYELIAALAERYQCEPSAKAVLARVRAARPGLLQAMATEVAHG